MTSYVAQHTFTSIKRLVTAVIVIAAVAAPSAAYARFNLNPPPTTGAAPVATRPLHVTGGRTVPVRPAVHRATASSPSNFQWGDAAIGAAAAIVLVGLGGAVVAGARRREHPALTS